ncbi:hypothetical protein [Kribbella sp. NPDC055071]
MNLQNLRDELTTRAADTDNRPTDLLPGIRRKVRRTRQRRFAAAAGTAVVAVALAATILPGTLTNSSPAEPPSYTQNGYSLPGELNGDPLLKGWVGQAGENHVEFDWTPTTKQIQFDGHCTRDTDATIWVRVNGFTVASRPCQKDIPIQPSGVSFETALWADAPLDKPAKVTLDLVTFEGKPIQDTAQQLAVGIYSAKHRGLEQVQAPDRAGDYVRDGLRFRKVVGDQTRLGAVIGDRGVNEVSTTFVPRSHAVVVQTLGTAEDYLLQYPNGEYRVQVRFGDGSAVNGYLGYGDQAQADSADAMQLTAPVGKPLTVTARLVDNKGRPVSVPKSRIGVGIYDPGTQITQNGIDFDQVKDLGNTRYRFVRSVVVPATQGKVELTTPVGKPFIWAYGSVGIGAGVWTRWDGLTAHQDGPMSGGFRWVNEDAQTEPKTVRFYVNAGKPTGGKLAIALYEPVP